jgi:hypothetical protein
MTQLSATPTSLTDLPNIPIPKHLADTMLAPNMINQLLKLPTNRIAISPPPTQHASKPATLSMTLDHEPAPDNERPLLTPTKRVLVFKNNLPRSVRPEREQVPAVGTPAIATLVECVG